MVALRIILAYYYLNGAATGCTNERAEKMRTIECVAVVQTSDEMICDCGGVMERTSRGALMSDPPRFEVACPVCGYKRLVFDYSVRVSFKAHRQ